MSRRRRVLLLVGALAFALIVLDGLRPPGKQVATTLALAGIHAYQNHLRGAGVKAGVRCRFEPTCSRFAEAVVTQDGAWLGGLRAAWRILRCGPWTRPGTKDPP